MNYYVTYSLFKETGKENFDNVLFEIGKNKDPESEIIKMISRDSGEHPDNIYIWDLMDQEEHELMNFTDLDIDADVE